MNVRRTVVCVAYLLLAFLAQALLAARMTIGVARPDFLIVAAACIGLLAPMTEGVVYGISAGLLMAVLVGFNYASHIISRASAGWVSAKMGNMMSHENLLTPLIGVAAATLTAQIVTLAMAPMALGPWWRQTLGEILYNAICMMSLYLIVRRLIRPGRPLDSYERRLRKSVKMGIRRRSRVRF